MKIAMLTDVFFDANAESRLAAALQKAASQGASLAVLPEIPLNPWSPATKDALDSDAEPPNGTRHEMMSRCAQDASIALVGGAIVKDPTTGERRNTALVFDSKGKLVGSHQKQHLPEEPGFWETSHYGQGTRPIGVIDVAGVTIGVQICSDINRPMGSHIQAALGAQIIINPRSTEETTYERWRHVFLATAWTTRSFIISVNRPRPEQRIPIGGPSIAIAPNQDVLAETNDTVSVVELDLSRLDQAKTDYPGYLPVRADLYEEAWERANERPAC